MTTIIAKETSHHVLIGYDSQATADCDRFELVNDKVFQNNGVVYGAAGSGLFANEIRHADLPKPPSSALSADHWVTKVLSPVLRDIFDQVTPKRTTDEVESNLLVITNGRVYQIFGDTGWSRRTNGVYGIGSGSPYALGALHAGATFESALEAAATFDAYTGYTLHLTTDTELLSKGI